MAPSQKLRQCLDQMEIKETKAPLVLPETTALMDSPVSLALPAPLVPLALAETSLLRCPILTTPNQVALLSLAPLVPWVPVVPLDLLETLALKVSLDPLVSLVSPALVVPWVLVVLLALPERTEMMVSLANLVAPVSAELLVLRVPVVSLELLDFLASRDTEVSLV